MLKFLKTKVPLWRATILVFVAVVSAGYWVHRTGTAAEESLGRMQVMSRNSAIRSFTHGCFVGGQIHSFFLDKKIIDEWTAREQMIQYCLPASESFSRGLPDEE